MVSIARAFLVRTAAVALLGATLALASASVTPDRAEAQVSNVQALPKATIGLGVVGAEIGLIVPALIFGGSEWWPYLVFPVLGAAGGAVGGYFLDVEMQRVNNPEVSVAIMAVGLALLVPTIIGTLALTAYSPPSESSQADEDMEYEPAAEGDSVEAVQEETSASPDEGSSESSPQSRLEQRIRALYAGGPGLLRLHQGQLLLGIPMISSLPTFTAEEMDRMNLQQRSDISVPLVSATF